MMKMLMVGALIAGAAACSSDSAGVHDVEDCTTTSPKPPIGPGDRYPACEVGCTGAEVTADNGSGEQCEEACDVGGTHACGPIYKFGDDFGCCVPSAAGRDVETVEFVTCIAAPAATTTCE